MTNVVGELIQQQGCVLLGLAEVRRAAVLKWIPQSRREYWEVLEDKWRTQHDFDIAIAYDKSLLVLLDHVWVRRPLAGNNVRAGLVATFGFTDRDELLIVASAHWRSNMGDAAAAERSRTAAAESLRLAIAASLERAGKNTPVIIMGDFNAEPFSAQFDASLPISRARDVVRTFRPKSTSDLLFYSPTWRLLGERVPWHPQQSPPTLAGTYRLEGQSPTAWRTFDQVLVSASLLKGQNWYLAEDHLRIFVNEDLFDAQRGRIRSPLDHLPIVGQLCWQQPPLRILETTVKSFADALKQGLNAHTEREKAHGNQGRSQYCF